MFEPARDQAAGLRGLFHAGVPALLPLGCTSGDAAERRAVTALVQALAQAGRRPLLLDLLGDAAPCGAFAHLDAGRVLGHGAGADDLVELTRALCAGVAGGYDVVVVAADPLRLADLTAGVARRIVLVGSARHSRLARVYAQVKALHLAHGLGDYVTAFLDAETPARALAWHRRLAGAAARFLGVAVEFGGVLAGAGVDRDARDRCALEALGWSSPMPAVAPC